MFPHDGQLRLRFVRVVYFVVLGMDRDGIMVSKVRWVNTTHFSTWDGQVGQVGRCG